MNKNRNTLNGINENRNDSKINKMLHVTHLLLLQLMLVVSITLQHNTGQPPHLRQKTHLNDYVGFFVVDSYRSFTAKSSVTSRQPLMEN